MLSIMFFLPGPFLEHRGMGDGLRGPADERSDKAWGSSVDSSAKPAGGTLSRSGLQCAAHQS
jgi:hypothetical protein